MPYTNAAEKALWQRKAKRMEILYQLKDELNRIKRELSEAKTAYGVWKQDRDKAVDENKRLKKALGKAAKAASDEIINDCGEQMAQRVFHAVKFVVRMALEHK